MSDVGCDGTGWKLHLNIFATISEFTASEGSLARMSDKVIALIDMDCFYVQVRGYVEGAR